MLKAPDLYLPGINFELSIGMWYIPLATFIPSPCTLYAMGDIFSLLGQTNSNGRYGLRLPIPPGLVMAVAFSQTVEDVSENARANLEYIDMRFGSAVYAGDTIENGRQTGHPFASSRPSLA